VNRCQQPLGDLNGSGVTNVIDVQCAINLALAALSGSSQTPTCLVAPAELADVDCDETRTVGDTILVINAALGLPVAPGLDQNADSCPDSCELRSVDWCAWTDNGPCDDGNRCTVGDACEGGSCEAGAPLFCDDGEVCTVDSCSPGVGCVHTPTAACGASCSGVELPDDGVDSDCDGAELFLGAQNELAILGELASGAFSVGVAGEFEMGPFGTVTVSGTLSRAGAGASVSWCVTGQTNSDVGPLELDGLTLTLCRSAAGVVTGSFAGELDLGQGPVAATGSFGPAGLDSVTVSIADHALAPGIRIAQAVLVANGGASEATWSGTIELGPSDNPLALAFSGQYSQGDVDMALQTTPGATWEPFGSTAVSIGEVLGTLSRTAGVWSAFVTGQANVEFGPGLNLLEAEASVTLGTDAPLSVSATGSLAVGAFSAAVTGTFTENGGGEGFVGCATGQASGATGGINLTNLSLTACKDANGAATATLNGTLSLNAPGGGVVVEVEGTYDSPTATLCLAGQTQLLGEAPAALTVSLCSVAGVMGPVQLGATIDFPGVATLHFTGVYDPSANSLCLTDEVALQQPVGAELIASVCVVAGEFESATVSYVQSLGELGQVSLEGALVSGAGPLCLEGLLALQAPANAELGVTVCIEDGVVGSATLRHNANLGSLGQVELLGTYDGAAESVCLEGNLEIGSNGSTVVEVEGCVADKKLENLTVHLTSNFPGVGALSLSGSYAGEGAPLCLAGNLSLAGSSTVLAASACLVDGALQTVKVQYDQDFAGVGHFALSGDYTPGSATLCLEGTLTVGAGVGSVLQANTCLSGGKIQEIVVTLEQPLGQNGDLSLSANYVPGASTLCFEGEFALTSPAQTALEAEACIEAGVLSEVELRYSQALPGVGTLLFEGNYAPTEDSLCLSASLALSGGAELGANACVVDKRIESIQVALNTSLGELGELALEGSYVPGATQLCVGGVLDIDAGPGTTVNASGCLVGGSLHTVQLSVIQSIGSNDSVTLQGEYTAGDATLCLEATLSLGAPQGASLLARACVVAKKLQTVTFTYDQTIPGVGSLELSGTYDSGADSICFDGGLELSGADADITAHACLVGGGLTVVELTYTQAINGTGSVSLTGTYNPAGSEVCLDGDLSFGGAAGTTLDAHACVAVGKLDVFELTLVQPIGPGATDAITLTGTYTPGQAEFCLSGDLQLSAPAAVQVTAKACLENQVFTNVEFVYAQTFSGVGKLEMVGAYDPALEQLCFDGELDLQQSASNFQAHACLVGKSLQTVELTYTQALGSFGDLQVSGVYTPGANSFCVEGALDITTPVDVDITADTCIAGGKFDGIHLAIDIPLGAGPPLVIDVDHTFGAPELCFDGNIPLGAPSGADLKAHACVNNKALSSVSLTFDKVFPNFGVLHLAGTLDGDIQSVCLDGTLTITKSGTSLDAHACIENKQLTEVEVTLSQELAGFGQLDLAGTYVAGTSTLCLEGDLVLAPPASTVIHADACVVDGKLDTLHLSLDQQLGNESLLLTGDYTFGDSTLCLAASLDITSGIDAELAVGACVVAGKLSTLTITGSLEFAGASVAVMGTYQNSTICLDGDLQVGGAAPAALHVHTCLVGKQIQEVSVVGTITIPQVGTTTLSGVYSASTQSVCLAGAIAVQNLGGATFGVQACLTEGEFASVGLFAQDVQIAPGFVLDEVKLLVGAQTVVLTGSFSIQAGADELVLSVSGAYTGSGNFELTLGLAGDGQWNPIPQLGITFSDIQGTVARTDGEVSASFVGDLGANLNIGNEFSLNEVSASGGFVGGVWSFALNGRFTINVSGQTLELLVSAGIQSGSGGGQQSLLFTGTTEEPFMPFPTTLGDDFLIEDLSASVQVPLSGQGELVLAFGGDARICAAAIYGSCSPSEYWHVGVDLEFSYVGGEARFLAMGSLDGDIDLGLGQLCAIRLVGTTHAQEGVDVFGTPADTNDDVDVAAGLSLYAYGGWPFGNFIPNSSEECSLLHVFAIGPDGIQFEVQANLSLDVVGTQGQACPSGASCRSFGVDWVTLESVGVSGAITPSGVSACVNAAVEWMPNNPYQQAPLDGSTAMCGSVGSGGTEIEGSLAIDGRWYEPFGLPRFAIQNLAFDVALIISSYPPVLSKIGISNDLFWLKRGNSWPAETIWPVPTEAEYIPGQPAPDLHCTDDVCVTKLGGSFYFDIDLTPSGLCFFGNCLPLPTFMFRADIQNLEFPADFINMTGDVVEGVYDKLDGHGPQTFEIPNFSTEPVDIQIDKLVVYASTHNFSWANQKWVSGILTEADLDFAGTQVQLTGFADTKGLFIEGEIEAFDLLNLGVLEMVGDPFRRYAKMNSGYVEIPSNAANTKLTPPKGTIEGWVLPQTTSTSAFNRTLFNTQSGTQGVSIGVGDGKVSFRVRNGTSNSANWMVVSTTEKVLTVNEWAHISVVYDGNKVGIYVGGAKQDTVQTGPSVAVVPSTTAVRLGTGLLAFDDVRVWNEPRSRADLKGNCRTLEPGYQAFADLVARYEADFDANDNSGSAYNTRRYPEGTAPLHGKYFSAAQSTLDIGENNGLRTKLALRLPGTAGSEDGPGFWLQAGVIMDVPFVGKDPDFTAVTQLNLSKALSGHFYAPDFTILPLGFGEFFAGGYGPNLYNGDFDDGLYGAFSLEYGTFALTGKLGWRSSSGDQVTFAGDGSGGGSGISCKDDEGADSGTIAAVSISYQCETNGVGECTDPEDKIFLLDSVIDLTIELGALGSFGLVGSFDIAAATEDWAAKVAGSLVVFGHCLLSVDGTLNQCGITTSATVEFPPFEVFGFTVQIPPFGIGVAFGFPNSSSKCNSDNLEPYQLCLSTGFLHDGSDESEGSSFSCSVGFCVGGTGFPIELQFQCGDWCINSSTCDANEACIWAKCRPRLPDGSGCLTDNYCQSDLCSCYACQANDKSNGEECWKDEECSSGFCVGADDCIVKNKCGTAKEMGESCNKNSECESGECEGESSSTKHCVCDTDSDCDPNEECDTGWGEVNTCYCGSKSNICSSSQYCTSGGSCLSRKNLGASCSSSDQCKSRLCGVDGTCVCRTSSDCASGQSCKVVVQNNALGFPEFDNFCFTCLVDTDCAQDEYCDSGGTNQCKFKKKLGGSCTKDAACAVGACFGGICGCGGPEDCDDGEVCTSAHKCACVIDKNTFTDCSSGQYCAGPNGCQPKRDTGDACTTDKQCFGVCDENGVCKCDPLEQTGCGEEAGQPGLPMCKNTLINSDYDNACVECLSAADCAQSGFGLACTPEGVCVQPKPLGQPCNSGAECLSETCEYGLAVPIGPPGGKKKGICVCGEDADCALSPSGKYCAPNADTGAQCVKCTLNAHCPSGEFCDQDTYTCEPKLPVGSACVSASQCLGGSCGIPSGSPIAKSECLCTTTAPCLDGHTCKISTFPPGVTNKCVCGTSSSDCDDTEYCSGSTCLAKKNFGASCSVAHECVSESCYEGKCGCKTSSDCAEGETCDTVGADAGRCYCGSAGNCTSTQYCGKETTGSYQCLAKKADLAPCAHSYQCLGACGDDAKCHCIADATVCFTVEQGCNNGCPVAKSYCDVAGGTANPSQNACVECETNSHCLASEYCSSSSGNCVADKALGAACSLSAECQSGRCESFVCVCNADAHCPGNQDCAIVTGNNYCFCGSDGTCSSSEYCSASSHTCVNEKNLGATCGAGYECKSGLCELGKCVCASSFDCPPGDKCNNPPLGANFCD
jgi:hypothetical protein